MQRISLLKQRIGGLFSEYCSRSSIHGIAHVGSSERSLCERVGWLLIMLGSLCGCALLIKNIYNDWEERPIILTVNDQMTLTSDILFPTVTICPEATHRLEKVNFEDLFIMFDDDRYAMSEDELQVITSLLQLCENIDVWSLVDFQAPERLSSVLLEIFPNISIASTLMKGMPAELDKVLTEEGICFASRSMAPAREIFRTKNVQNIDNFIDKWMDSVHNRPDINISFYLVDYGPTGNKTGFQMKLTIPSFYAKNSQCRKSTGFKIMLNDPVEYPLWSDRYFHLTNSHKMSIAIKPDIMVASEELRSYAPEKRKCFFEDEKRLKFFTVYTRYNCELERLINLTKALSGCGYYWMPRDNATPVCTNKHVGSSDRYSHRYSRDKSHCLPACNSVEYNVDFIQSSYLAPIGNGTRNEYDYVELEVFFDRGSYMGLKRTEIYGWVDFIANCGGALGLCMGVSLLSLVELVYYFLMRPLANFQKPSGSSARNVIAVQPISNSWVLN